MAIQIYNIADLLKLELPGCQMPLTAEEYTDIMYSMRRRLWAVTTYGNANTLAKTIEMQSVYFPMIEATEYILNEMQHEIRYQRKKDMTMEKRILNQWCAFVAERTDADTAIDFYTTVITKRQQRTF